MAEKYIQQDLYKKSGDVPAEEVESLEIGANIAEEEQNEQEFSDETNQELAKMDGGEKARHIYSAETRRATLKGKKTLRDAVEMLDGKKPKDLFEK